VTEKILVSIQLCNILFMIKGEVDASVATLLREHVHVGSWVSGWQAARALAALAPQRWQVATINHQGLRLGQ